MPLRCAGEFNVGELVSKIGVGNTLVATGALAVESAKFDILRSKGNVYIHLNPSLNTVNVGNAKNPAQILMNISGPAKLAGQLTVVGGIGIEVGQGILNVRSGVPYKLEVLKTTLDIEMGLLMGIWPIGTVVGGGYFVIDTLVGWENVGQ